MSRFLIRPPLPDMPVHVLDWALTPSPHPALPFRMDAVQRARLAGLVTALLQPPLRLIDPDEDEEEEVAMGGGAPFFVGRWGRHPDLGWPLARLICPPAWERWSTEDDPDRWFGEDEEDDLPWMEHRPNAIWVHHRGDVLEIGADRICLQDNMEGEDELLQVVQGVTGLAFYSEEGLLLHEPVACAVCKHHFTLWGEGREVNGCGECGVEWVEVLP